MKCTCSDTPSSFFNVKVNVVPVDPETGQPLADGGDPNAPIMEPDLEGETLVKELPIGGEI